jgi:oligopeptide/dipeptide ABC transporter ATP-binding protein
MSESNEILRVENLHTRFRTFDGVVHAVNGLSYSLRKGETLAIVGESGSGKSVSVLSLLRLLPRAITRIEGRAVLRRESGETELLGLSTGKLDRIRGKSIGIVFQDALSALNPVMTIGEQIAESLTTHLGTPKGEAKRRAVELLERVGIPSPEKRFSSYPHQFSGGMRQRAMIAIAIACTPAILVADEPTTALDVTIQTQITDLTTRLQQEMGMTVIWITHDLGVVAGIADRVMVMYAGMAVESASVDELYERPRHPYTMGLLKAIPEIGATKEKRLASIGGAPPDLFEAPRHCQFAWRCPYVFDRCWKEIPEHYRVGEEHTALCFYDFEKGGPR